MANVTTYNPKKVTCALGNHIVSGFNDDSFITIEPAGDGTSYVVGADGEIARSIDPSRVYTVKIALLQNSKKKVPGRSLSTPMIFLEKKSLLALWPG